MKRRIILLSNLLGAGTVIHAQQIHVCTSKNRISIISHLKEISLLFLFGLGQNVASNDMEFER